MFGVTRVYRHRSAPRVSAPVATASVPTIGHMLAMVPMTTDNLDACGEFDTTAVDRAAGMLIDSHGVEMSASSRTVLSPARQPDLHVPRRLGDRDARQNRIHPREIRNDKRDI